MTCVGLGPETAQKEPQRVQKEPQRAQELICHTLVCVISTDPQYKHLRIYANFFTHLSHTLRDVFARHAKQGCLKAGGAVRGTWRERAHQGIRYPSLKAAERLRFSLVLQNPCVECCLEKLVNVT